MTPIPRLRAYAGPAILSYGFRPFFFAAAAWSGLGILIWLPLLSGDIGVPTAMSPLDWHIHEMLYGYVPAVVTGFLLTAIPNWTGRLPLQGGPLAVLVAAWIAGRIAVFDSALIGPLPAAAIDLLFLALVAAAAAREVIAGRNWHNLPPVAVLLLFLAGNAIFHVEDFSSGAAELGTRLGIAAAVSLITLIGGRVVPSFTRNWLARENPGRLPVPFGRFDMAVVGVSTLTLAVWIALPTWRPTAALMILAALLHAIRLARWVGWRASRDWLVLVLHVAYGFVALGFAVLAASIAWPAAVPLSAGIHVWTVGAIGTMTLAIMTRATLGHTGQSLAAGPLTRTVYAAVVAAAILRVAAAFPGSGAQTLLHLAGAAWIAAFWLFAVGYAPALWRPRAAAH
ncbi:MAG TPA: NnrS family protein [Hyphomicrobiales bacterium]|nr:NnrS family protein [Hyphomicrobiales bacterium]